MGLTEHHWFEDEEPELTFRQLEKSIDDLDKAYKKGYADGYKDGAVQSEQKHARNELFNYAAALNAIPRTVKVTDYTEIVSGYEAEVGGKCGACGGWVYDELPYCPHCGKRLDWGTHE